MAHQGQPGYLQQKDVISLPRACKVWVAVVLLDLEGLPAVLSLLECVGSQDDSQRFVPGEIKHSECHQLVPVTPGNTDVHLPGHGQESPMTQTQCIYIPYTQNILWRPF